MNATTILGCLTFAAGASFLGNTLKLKEEEYSTLKRDRLLACSAVVLGLALLYMGHTSAPLPPQPPSLPGCRSIGEFKEVMGELSPDSDMAKAVQKIETSPHGLNLLEWNDSFRHPVSRKILVKVRDMTHSVMVGCTPEKMPFFALRHDCKDGLHSYYMNQNSTSIYSNSSVQLENIHSPCVSLPYYYKNLFHRELDNLLTQNWTHVLDIKGDPIPQSLFRLV